MRDSGVPKSIVDSLLRQSQCDATVRDVQLLADSTQARVFVVELDGVPNRIIVKLFKEQQPGVAAALDDEFESLTLMANAFLGAEVDGWPIRAPEPLLRSSTPTALVMTAVPGVPVESILQELSSQERRDLAHRVCEALVLYWSYSGRIIADVTLSNILSDTPGRQLAFVDPGLPDPAFSCPGIPSNFSPTSRDLAFLLTNVLASNVRIGLLARRRARIRAEFAAEVLRHYVVNYLTSDQLPAFISEVDGCANCHIARIQVVGPRQLWRRFVRLRVRHRLTATFHGLAPSDCSEPHSADGRHGASPGLEPLTGSGNEIRPAAADLGADRRPRGSRRLWQIVI